MPWGGVEDRHYSWCLRLCQCGNSCHSLSSYCFLLFFIYLCRLLILFCLGTHVVDIDDLFYDPDFLFCWYAFGLILLLFRFGRC